ncbi:MAG: hypothetical protein EXX96DRAFT_553778 [Benjaminiella poitrasii]|nr:MAG: hypothetical protein EXX96DRAFT_553778 [Benjaminiella poitrasii]
MRLFESKDLFLKRLIQSPFKDDESMLMNISQRIVNQPDLFNTFGLQFIEYLTKPSSAERSLVNLKCLNIYFAPYLDRGKNDLELIKEASSLIFSYCLEIYSSGQHLSNIEIYQVLYPLLDQCAPSDVNNWKKELDKLPIEKTRKTLQHYESIIHDYLCNPSIYPAEISITESTQMHNICASFTLFNILYAAEMKPIKFKHQESFQFSNSWTQFLIQMNNSFANNLFNTRTLLIENKLRVINTESIKILPDQLHVESFTFKDRQEFELTFRECLQSLKVAHTRYLTKIVYCLLQLLLYASTTYEEQFQEDIHKICQATWFEMYQCLLDNAVFETVPFTESPTFQRLFKLSACYIQYRHLSLTPYVEFPLSIWDHFYLQRSLFLKSIDKLENNADDLAMIEKVIFTSTSI